MNPLDKPLAEDCVAAGDAADAGDSLSPWVTERLSGLMVANGVPLRQQASLLGELCGLSLNQARRKLRGAAWSFGEVFVLVQYFGASLDAVFSASAPEKGEQVRLSSEADALAHQDATFLMGVGSLPCRVRIGAKVVASPGERELLTAGGDTGWYVGSHELLAGQRLEPPYFEATQVLITPEHNHPPVRVAILDDDVGTAETLAEWFNEAGHFAQDFTCGEQLLSSGIENFDAFVVDFMLAGGDSSQAIIKAIHHALPAAPIVLLTGRLRTGHVSEAELITLLRALNVSFSEKPVRPSVLAATIEKDLDQLAKG